MYSAETVREDTYDTEVSSDHLDEAWRIAAVLQTAASKLQEGQPERALLEQIVDALSLAGDTAQAAGQVA